MKKWLVAGIVLMMCLEVIGLAGAQTPATKSPSANISGVYDVTFTSDQGQQQSAKITIEDKHNGKVDVSGDYKGYPVSITGDLTGDVEKEGAVCSFDLNKPGLISGKAEMTIRLVDNKYQLQGQGNGVYSYLGSSGQFSGRVEGSRQDTVSRSSHSSSNMAAIITGVLLLAAIAVFWVWRRRAKRERVS